MLVALQVNAIDVVVELVVVVVLVANVAVTLVLVAVCIYCLLVIRFSPLSILNSVPT